MPTYACARPTATLRSASGLVWPVWSEQACGRLPDFFGACGGLTTSAQKNGACGGLGRGFAPNHIVHACELKKEKGRFYRLGAEDTPMRASLPAHAHAQHTQRALSRLMLLLTVWANGVLRQPTLPHLEQV